MQVNRTPGRARIPEDEDDTRTVRPRLDMSALVSESCERHMPEIDWKKLGAGLKLDEAQLEAGRQTEVKRMLEFEVYVEFSEELARG